MTITPLCDTTTKGRRCDECQDDCERTVRNLFVEQHCRIDPLPLKTTTITTPPDIMYGTRPCTDVEIKSAQQFTFSFPYGMSTYASPVCQHSLERFACAVEHLELSARRSCEC